MWTNTICIWTLSLLFCLQPPNVSSQSTVRTSAIPPVRTTGPPIQPMLHDVVPTIFNEFDGWYLGYSWQGGVRRPDRQSTLAECRNTCQTDTQCLSFDYNTEFKECWLHLNGVVDTCSTAARVICAACLNYRKKSSFCGNIQTSTSPTPTVPTSAVITTEDPNAGDTYNDARPSISYGGGVKAGNFAQKELCWNACYTDTTCQGVDYNTANNDCWKHTSSTVCGTERTTCTTCTHYKNKRATCYSPSGTQATTQAPSGTTQPSITARFKPVENNKDLSVNGVFVTSGNLNECLTKCNVNAACHGTAYSNQGLCYWYTVSQACGIRVGKNGWVLYSHIRQTCGQPIYNDFNAPLNNKKQAFNNWISSINTLETCLIQCKASASCKAVNFNLVSKRCEHVVTARQCSALVSATNSVHYLLKTVNCNPGATTTTTLAPVTAAVRQCWTRMTQRGQCAKPGLTTAQLALRIEEMESYCRTYNVYFECVVTRFRTTDCPTITRTALANYVRSLPALKTNNIYFCQIFSQGLQTCLAGNPAQSEVTRCQNQVRQANAGIKRGITAIAICDRLRDYIECVRSVVEFRCRDFATEYYEKSTRYILSRSFSDCAKSQPKISGLNTLYGPATGLSQLEVRGRTIGPGGTPMLLFNLTTNPCQGANTVIRNSTHLICKTIPGEANEQNFVQLRYTSGSYNNVYFSAGNFTYKQDPRVAALTQTKTVVGGGTLVTVLGTYLAYVVTPTFTVTRQDNGMVYESICRINEEDTDARDVQSLVCQVPAITLRQTSSVKPGEQVTNEDFRTGLKLDGVTTYEDLTLAGFLTGNTLQVYGPPDIDENPDKSFEFKRFWPVSQTKLEIPGQSLDTAATSRDYTVLVGQMPCQNLELTSTTMTCEPPADNPYTNDTQPPVIVKAPGPDGFQTGIQVGTLDYQNSIFDNSAGKYGLIGAAVGVAVIFIILIVICCCCCEGCACNNRNKGYEESVD